MSYIVVINGVRKDCEKIERSDLLQASLVIQVENAFGKVIKNRLTAVNGTITQEYIAKLTEYHINYYRTEMRESAGIHFVDSHYFPPPLQLYTGPTITARFSSLSPFQILEKNKSNIQNIGRNPPSFVVSPGGNIDPRFYPTLAKMVEQTDVLNKKVLSNEEIVSMIKIQIENIVVPTGKQYTPRRIR